MPEEAERYLGRGQAAVEIAKLPEEFQRAIVEFQKAVRSAPWLANGYYDLGVVQEKVGKFSDGMRSLKLYLLAAPDAKDAAEVKARVYALEYKAERRNEETRAAEQQRLARQREEEEQKARVLQILDGTWQTKPDDRGAYDIYEVRVSGTMIEVAHIAAFFLDWGYKRFHPKIPQTWRGNISGFKIEGTFFQDDMVGKFSSPMTGTIASDGSKIELINKAMSGAGEIRRSVTLVRSK